MKTKELIRQLEECDPEGEMECCVQNLDISDVLILPAYYDGCLQLITRNKEGCTVSVKYCAEGSKLVIYPISIRDLIFDEVDIPVEFDSEYSRNRYVDIVEEYRKESIKIGNNVERGCFIDYICNKIGFRDERFVEEAIKFYNENMDYRDEMPQDIILTRTEEGWIPSWNTRRYLQWDREIRISRVSEDKIIIERVV